MPSPSASLSTLRPDLGGSMEEFNLAADRQGFIGTKVFPVLEVAKQAGVYGKIPIEQLLANRETRRAPGSGYSRQQWKFETDTYATEEHGAEEPVDDREAEIYREYIDAEMVSAERARDVVLRNFEKRCATLAQNTGTLTTTAATTAWATVASAVPITDVEACVIRIWEATGLWPNAAIMTRKTFRNLRRTAQITDAIKYVSGTLPEQVNVGHIAAAFDLPMIIIAGSAKNTAAEGQAATIASVWNNDYVTIARICETNDIREPGYGRTFHWGADGSSIGATVESYRDETIRGEVIRARMDTQEKEMYVACAQIIDTTP